MKKTHKILILVLATLIIFFIGSGDVLAASTSLSGPSSVESGNNVTVYVTLSNVAAWNITISAKGATSGATKRYADATEDAMNTTKRFAFTCKSSGEGKITITVKGDASTESGKLISVSETKTITVNKKKDTTKPASGTSSGSSSNSSSNTSSNSSNKKTTTSSSSEKTTSSKTTTSKNTTTAIKKNENNTTKKDTSSENTNNNIKTENIINEIKIEQTENTTEPAAKTETENAVENVIADIESNQVNYSAGKSNEKTYKIIIIILAIIIVIETIAIILLVRNRK